MIKKRFFIAVVAIVCGICLLFGCFPRKIGYHAKITVSCEMYEYFPEADCIFTEKFWTENVVSGAMYKNNAWQSGDDYEEQYVWGEESYPKSWTYILTNKTEYDEVLIDGTYPDFDKKVYLVYVYCTFFHEEKKLKKVEYADKKVTVEFGSPLKRSCGPGRATGKPPVRRCIIVEMDKVEIEEVEFCELHPTEM